MPLPEFNELDDLPEGRHIASLEEVITRFGRDCLEDAWRPKYFAKSAL